MALHIGQLIRQKMEERGMTVASLSRKYGCSRVNMYKIFDKPTIDTGMLLRFSLLLNFDFFQYYRQELSDKSLQGMEEQVEV